MSGMPPQAYISYPKALIVRAKLWVTNGYHHGAQSDPGKRLRRPALSGRFSSPASFPNSASVIGPKCRTQKCSQLRPLVRQVTQTGQTDTEPSCSPSITSREQHGLNRKRDWKAWACKAWPRTKYQQLHQSEMHQCPTLEKGNTALFSDSTSMITMITSGVHSAIRPSPPQPTWFSATNKHFEIQKAQALDIITNVFSSDSGVVQRSDLRW